MIEVKDELRALLARATKGPWVATERSGYHELLAPDAECDWYGHKGMHAVVYCDTEIDEGEQEANAALIVAIRNHLPALLDHIDALEAGREGAIEALRLIDSDAYGTRPAPDGYEPGEYLAALAGHYQGRIAWCRAIAREALAKPKEG